MLGGILRSGGWDDFRGYGCLLWIVCRLDYILAFCLCIHRYMFVCELFVCRILVQQFRIAVFDVVVSVVVVYILKVTPPGVVRPTRKICHALARTGFYLIRITLAHFWLLRFVAVGSLRECGYTRDDKYARTAIATINTHILYQLLLLFVFYNNHLFYH